MVKLKKMLVIFLVTIVILIAGCSGGNYTITIGEVDFKKDSASGSYERFNGYKYKDIKLEEGNIINLNLNVITEEGCLEVKVLDKENNEMLIMDSYTVEQEQQLFIEKTGKYKIRVEGDKHKGEFLLEWDVSNTDL